jgi:hypothetical protein
MCFSGEVLRQLGDHTVPSLRHAYLVLSILGLLLFLSGAVRLLVDLVRTTRRPFVEHLDGVFGALGREYELIGALLRFDAVTLELASERLSIQSTKVASRVGLIGGGEGLKTSLVGVVALAFAWFSQYALVVQGLTMKSFAFIGLALLVGLSIGGMLLRYGASEADYYRGLIRIALNLKAHDARTVREPFARRMRAMQSRG